LNNINNFSIDIIIIVVVVYIIIIINIIIIVLSRLIVSHRLERS